MKKGNIGAMVLITIVLLSTVLVYVGNNSQLMESNAITSATSNYEDVLQQAVATTVDDVLNQAMEKGYSNQSILWHESGSFGPDVDEYIEWSKTMIGNSLMGSLSVLNEELEDAYVNYTDMDIIAELDNSIPSLIFKIEGIRFIENLSDQKLINTYEFTMNFSKSLYMRNKMLQWSELEGNELYNEISDSFQGYCGTGCTCTGGHAAVVPLDTNLSEETILGLVDDYVEKLNSNYFVNDEGIYCDSEVITINVNENENYSTASGGAHSKCDAPYVGFSTVNMIWDEETSIIDGSSSQIILTVLKPTYGASHLECAPPLAVE